MPGRLTTHVLDTARGRAAVGVKIELWRLDDDTAPDLLLTARTNEDGRTDAPMLSGDRFVPGTYEFRFWVGDYFAAEPVAVADPPFLDVVPVRFTIADPDAHYHVPLLTSSWAYSTYRGS